MMIRLSETVKCREKVVISRLSPGRYILLLFLCMSVGGKYCMNIDGINLELELTVLFRWHYTFLHCNCSQTYQILNSTPVRSNFLF